MPTSGSTSSSEHDRLVEALAHKLIETTPEERIREAMITPGWYHPHAIPIFRRAIEILDAELIANNQAVSPSRKEISGGGAGLSLEL